MVKKPNTDVPIEAAVKYLIKEKDELKRKLDMIVPYTKSLEEKVQNLNKELQKKNNCIEDLRKRLQDCNTHASRTPQYKSLQEKYNQLKKDKNTLLLELGKIYRNQ